MQVNLLHPCLSRPHVCVVGRVCTTALSIANAHSELRAYLSPGPTAPFPFFFLERLHQCILTSSLTFRAVPNQLAHWCTAYDTPHLPSLMIGIILLWCESAYFFFSFLSNSTFFSDGGETGTLFCRAVTCTVFQRICRHVNALHGAFMVHCMVSI